MYATNISGFKLLKRRQKIFIIFIQKYEFILMKLEFLTI